ncbi:JAB N-terminal domain-containing protein [Dactylosporangium sp. NPDC049525]|uniref:JAB N-terminal domain-containing protein n=1 Tax=Dactylosporangium sp. NPDC049525 TaxID=3154730 RepID=UPI003439E018
MALGIEIYRTDDYVAVGRIDVLPVLLPELERLLGEPLRNVECKLTFYAIADDETIDGEPSVVNLRGGYGFVQVRIIRDGRVIYQHAHAVRELMGRPLQRILARQAPQERYWGFGLVGPELPAARLVRPAPEATGTMLVPGEGRGARASVFHLEELPDPEPDTAAAADLAPGADLAPPVPGLGLRVLLAPKVAADLRGGLPLSTETEDGGFLLGRLYRDAEHDGAHLVLITDVVAAERTGASMVHFTFTGESFLRAGDVIARRDAGERLVGWYHTHLFPASTRMGLSSIDVDLHHRTFRRPWQIAGLINLDGTERTLRFYGPAGDGPGMLEVPFGAAP